MGGMTFASSARIETQMPALAYHYNYVFLTFNYAGNTTPLHFLILLVLRLCYKETEPDPKPRTDVQGTWGAVAVI